MGSRLRAAFWSTIVVGTITSAIAFGQSYPIELVRGSPNSRIQGLELKLPSPEVGPDLQIAVQGKLSQSGWSLLGNSVPLIKNGAAHREFSFKITLTSAATPIKFLAIGPAGELVNERVYVRFPGWIALHQPQPKSPRRWAGQAGLGVTDLAYSQLSGSNLTDYSMIGLTLKAGGQYALRPGKWDLGVNGYFTLLPISSSGSTGQIRFFGINLKAGRAIPVMVRGARSPWTLKIEGGLYYTSTKASGGAQFRFTNMWGPEIYPMVERQFADGTSGYAYLKFSPIMNGFSVLSPSNRELAIGAGWIHPLPKGHSWSVGLDLAQFQFTITGSHVSSKSASLGAGYGF